MTEAVQETQAKNIETVSRANDRRPEIPKIKHHENNVWNIAVKEPGDLQKLFGGSSDELGSLLLQQCYAAIGNNPARMDKEGHVPLLVAELEPRDALEAMLTTQMAATHMAVMRHSTRLADAEHSETIALHERILTKLSRTFTAQMEALRKHRNGGKQTVTVQHVNVEDGGQAIVGNVQRGEGNVEK